MGHEAKCVRSTDVEIQCRSRDEMVRNVETIARLPGGLSEQIAIKGRSSW